MGFLKKLFGKTKYKVKNRTMTEQVEKQVDSKIYVWTKTERVGKIVVEDSTRDGWLYFTDGSRINPKLVNEFLDDMTNIILNNGGMIDKFMGDCIMAVFNAPIDMKNHADMAVKSAIEIEAKTKELKALYKERGLPDINVGTGVNTGTAIVGNMGSSTRFDYSVIGDAVNLAARLEATAGRGDYKEYPTLYSSYTMEQLTNIKSIEVDKIKVKGKEELITIYKPI